MKVLTPKEEREFDYVMIGIENSLRLASKKLSRLLERDVFYLELCDEIKRRADEKARNIEASIK